MAGWTFEFQGVRSVEGPNYYATRANIKVTHGGATEMIHPEKRFYPVAGTSTTEVAIRKTLGGDVYVALGDTIRDEPGVWRIRIAHHPLIDWVFGGAGLIASAASCRLRRACGDARPRREAPATEAALVDDKTPRRRERRHEGRSLIALLLQASAAEAPLPTPPEARAQALMRELRCVVCENEPVSQSTADMAVDMRRMIRVQIDKGASDSEVRKYFVDRYGQYVSFRPPTDGWGCRCGPFPSCCSLG